MNKEYQMVKEFHKLMGQPIGEKPRLLSSDRVDLRAKWLMEECSEFIDADNVEDQADALIDIIVFALGGFVEMGILPERLFEVVHQANMQKMGPGGKPIFIDGKVSKPPGFVPPNKRIAAILDQCTSNE